MLIYPLVEEIIGRLIDVENLRFDSYPVDLWLANLKYPALRIYSLFEKYLPLRASISSFAIIVISSESILILDRPMFYRLEIR